MGKYHESIFFSGENRYGYGFQVILIGRLIHAMIDLLFSLKPASPPHKKSGEQPEMSPYHRSPFLLWQVCYAYLPELYSAVSADRVKTDIADRTLIHYIYIMLQKSR